MDKTKLTELFKNQLDLICFEKIVFSNGRSKQQSIKNAELRLFEKKGVVLVQLSEFSKDGKALHTNLELDEFVSTCHSLLEKMFKQMLIVTSAGNCQVLVSASDNIKIIDKINYSALSSGKVIHSHDKDKKRLLNEGECVNFLVELGVMDSQGNVYKRKRSKFNQINNFLDYVDSVYKYFDEKEKINILDLCCGKSYLSFAIYHYFTNIKKTQINLLGIDLKEDVVSECSNLARRLSMKNLAFKCADITKVDVSDDIDLVVSLHACDIATDVAIAKAVKLGAKVILASPCCHNELSKQLSCENLEQLTKYPALLNRTSEIVTDGLRAMALEVCGYNVDVVDFIEISDTPKNLLIKAVKKNSLQSNLQINEQKHQEFLELCKFFNVDPSIKNMLGL